VLPRLAVLSVTASAEVLAERFVGRGREDAVAIAARFARPAPPLPYGLAMLSLDNVGPLEATVAVARRCLAQVSA
jgi:ribose 1,5-bisphosphokinase